VSIADRLREIRKVLDCNQQQMARALNVKLPSLRDYEQGKSIPGGGVVASFVAIGVNANWLLSGEGEMLLRVTLSEAQKEVVRLFRDYHTSNIAMPAVALSRENFAEEYPGVLDDFSVETSWVHEEIPELTLQQLIQWNNSFHIEFPYLHEPSGPSLAQTLRATTTTIEGVMSSSNIKLPLWVIGRVQEMVVQGDLSDSGIKPLLLLLDEIGGKRDV